MALEIITQLIDTTDLSREGSPSDISALLSDYRDRVQSLLPAHVQFVARPATDSQPPTDGAVLARLGVDTAECWAQSVAFAWDIA